MLKSAWGTSGTLVRHKPVFVNVCENNQVRTVCKYQIYSQIHKPRWQYERKQCDMVNVILFEMLTLHLAP